MEINRDMIKKARGLILFTTIVILCLWKYETVLALFNYVLNIVFPFIVGAAMAFALNVPMHFFEKKLFQSEKAKGKKVLRKLARPISLVLTFLGVIAVIGIVIFVVVPQLITTLGRLGESFQVFVGEVQVAAEKLFQNNDQILNVIANLEFDWDKIVTLGFNFIKSGAGSVFDTTFTAAKSIVSGITTFFIAFVFAIYILLQKEKLSIQIKKVVFAFIPKEKAKNVLEISSLTYKTFSSFLTGQCLEAVILGTMFVIVLSIFKIPFALLIGVLISFTALIPVFGAFLGCFIGAFLIFIESPVQALTFIVIFLVLQQLEGNFIYPYVVGGSVGLPSIWVLAAVSVGASLMGIVGMLIFIPIVSVVYALFRKSVYSNLKKNQINPKDIEEGTLK